MTWLPGVDGIEVEVAIMVCKGLRGEKKPTGTRMLFFVVVFFFCTKANCTCFIFLREDYRQLEIAAFYLHISEEFEVGGTMASSLICTNGGPVLTSSPAIWGKKF